MHIIFTYIILKKYNIFSMKTVWVLLPILWQGTGISKYTVWDKSKTSNEKLSTEFFFNPFILISNLPKIQ